SAHLRGVPVLAHAVTPTAVKAAVRLGARSVKHGYDLGDEAVEAMLASGPFFVPTLAYSQVGAGVARGEAEQAEVARLKATPVLEAEAGRQSRASARRSPPASGLRAAVT